MKRERDRAAGYPTHEQISIARYRRTRAIPRGGGRGGGGGGGGGEGKYACNAVCVSRCALATARKIASEDGYSTSIYKPIRNFVGAFCRIVRDFS